MDIQVAKFRETLDLLKPAVARKTTLKSIEHILLKEGQALATDLETFVVAAMPEANITTLVPFKDVAKLMQFTPGGEMLNIKVKGKTLSLAWSSGSATFPVESVETFPDVPKFVSEVEESLDADALIPALVEVLPYAATDDGRPVLQGVTLILENPIRVAAGDGYRMADKELPFSFPKDFITIIPPSSVKVLNHLWEKTPRIPPPTEVLVTAILSKKMVMLGHNGKEGLIFRFDNGTTAFVKLIQGSPPDFLKLIPKDEPILKVLLLAEDLALAVRRVAGVALDEKGIVRMDFKDNLATISAKSDGHKVETSFQTMECTGAADTLGLNVGYLSRYINDKQGIVTIEWTGKTSPVTFRSRNDPRVLIMPMAIK